MICYLDSSALGKLYAEEPGTAEVSRAVKEAELVGTVAISRAEVVAARGSISCGSRFQIS